MSTPSTASINPSIHSSSASPSSISSPSPPRHCSAMVREFVSKATSSSSSDDDQNDAREEVRQLLNKIITTFSTIDEEDSLLESQPTQLHHHSSDSTSTSSSEDFTDLAKAEDAVIETASRFHHRNAFHSDQDVDSQRRNSSESLNSFDQDNTSATNSSFSESQPQTEVDFGSDPNVDEPSECAKEPPVVSPYRLPASVNVESISS